MSRRRRPSWGPLPLAVALVLVLLALVVPGAGYDSAGVLAVVDASAGAAEPDRHRAEELIERVERAADGARSAARVVGVETDVSPFDVPAAPLRHRVGLRRLVFQ